MALLPPPAARGAARGAPLRLYLGALVLVPLLGVGVLATTIVQTAVDDAAGAARAERSVRAVASLDAAATGINQEVVPVLMLAVLQSTDATTGLGLSDDLQAPLRAQVLAQVQHTRAVTDRALAGVPAGSTGGLAARRATTSLQQLRAGADAPSLTLAQISAVYEGYLGVAGAVVAAEDAVAADAAAEDVSAATLRAVRDVGLASDLAQAASREVPLFLGMAVTSDPSSDTGPAWAQAQADHTLARTLMGDLSQPDLRAAWERARTSRAVTRLDDALSGDGAATLASGGSLVEGVTAVVGSNAARDAVLGGLVERAADAALASAGADRRSAEGARDRALALAAVVLLLSWAGALRLGGSTTRSLRLVAGQARRISEGELVDVAVTGPREVRTVSRALSSAVAGLRRVQDQARAVARGDLTDAVLEQPLPGPLGEVVHASVQQIVSAVRQREELQSALAHQAAHDALTELPNRAQALRLTSAALHRAQRTGSTTGLLFVDLDGFKAVNDSFGHACGDDVLREVARRLQAAVRSGDVVARLGGDEFVVLAEQVGSGRDLVDLAERVIASASAPITVRTASGERRVGVGASVGIATSRDAETDGDALFAQADAAVYRAKARGRGRAEVFDEALRAQLAERAELEAAITHGLAHGEMHLHYQPVVDLTSGRLHGYEALLRWDRPGHGPVPPDDFIPTAEESRLVCDLDRWVLHEATRQLQRWRTARPTPLGDHEPTVAVNISGRHLADSRVVQDVREALEASGLPARLLVLEVTETVLVDDPTATAHLDAVRALGVSTAIDDFGTGYTSIGQLGHIPVDTLKIDRSFIASDDPAHRALVTLMIQAAHTFGLTVVAEGVEELDQLSRLRADSCDRVQGYLLARPLAPDAAGRVYSTGPGRAPVPRPAHAGDVDERTPAATSTTTGDRR